jgi:deoxyribose-phosphate aldolase
VLNATADAAGAIKAIVNVAPGVVCGLKVAGNIAKIENAKRAIPLLLNRKAAVGGGLCAIGGHLRGAPCLSVRTFKHYD